MTACRGQTRLDHCHRDDLLNGLAVPITETGVRSFIVEAHLQPGRLKLLLSGWRLN